MRDWNLYTMGVLIAKVVFSGVLFLFFVSCEDTDRHGEGEKLAKVHCASCHLFTEPGLLPRRVWGEKVLPSMGLKMGMSRGPLYIYGDSTALAGLHPTVPQEDWDKIVHYYLNESENSISPNTIADQEASEVFEANVAVIDSLSVVSIISYDEKNENLLIGNGINSKLVTVDLDAEIIDSVQFESPPVKIEQVDSLKYVLTIGSINPSDEAEGKLLIGGKEIEELTRPVDFLIKDQNLDGYDDIFICNYGNNIGDFSLFENLKNGTYKKRIIHPLSGAIKVESANMDADDDNEIVVLFAQEHEMIMVWDYENNLFSGKKVLQFQPAFGSVDFQLKDMNDDGLTDIVLGNGDNSDLSTVLKNFHGVRVFLNKGQKEFSEAYFLPMHGVSKIAAEDFDLDGDNDILAISNFGDFTDPKFKSVQLLTNKGQLKFEPTYIEGLPDMRWQTIDVTDYDKDGDFDVFIGAFHVNLGPEKSSIDNGNTISWARLENRIN